jgi:hypothetical protein
MWLRKAYVAQERKVLGIPLETVLAMCTAFRPWVLVSLLACLTLALPALAAPISIATYSMQNGQSGSQTYFDDGYGGPGATGNPNASGSFLSGGLGQLTDGILSPTDIFDDRWIGWFSIQPTITFDLGALYRVDDISIHTSNWSQTFNDVGVFGPVVRSYSEDGVTFLPLPAHATSTADRSGDEPRFVDIPFEEVAARYVRVQLLDGTKASGTSPGAKPWIFISEAIANGTLIPEPASLALLSLAGLMPLRFRRRRQN